MTRTIENRSIRLIELADHRGWANNVDVYACVAHVDPRTGLTSQLFGRVRSAIEQINLQPGYQLEWGGEHEDSSQARVALAKPLPVALLIVVCLFNSIRATIVVRVSIPLIVIGITTGLLMTWQPFGFMALLGVLSVGGEAIKNVIILPSSSRFTNLGEHRGTKRMGDPTRVDFRVKRNTVKDF